MIINAATGGNSWYYAVKEDLTAGELEGVICSHRILSDIAIYLKDVVHKHNGVVVIIKKSRIV